jgi:endonuclease YncB( thermonuclease family)
MLKSRKPYEHCELDVSYQNLLNLITTELQSGIARVQKMLEYARLETYWKIGGHIRRYAAQSPQKNAISAEFYQRFSKDLSAQCGVEMSVDLLKRCSQFHKIYSKFPKNSPLTFSHYLALMRVADDADRLRLENKAIKQEMSCLDLKDEVARLTAVRDDVTVLAGKLIFTRGVPYVYCIRAVNNLGGNDSLQVDCGFQIFVDIPEGTETKQQCGRVIRSVKENGAYRIVADKDGRSSLYTYGACVERVVDGDTIDARIDVGFGIWLKCQRLRLRAIDAPEMPTVPGKNAQEFLLNYLSRCPKIVVRTTKASGEVAADAKEKFGRWLVDVFALPGCDDVMRIAAQGVYVNQMMIDEKMAEMY